MCLIQNAVKDSKEETVQNAVDLIKRAVDQYKPRIVALPECFYCPYDLPMFANVAEYIPDGFTSTAFRKLAKELSIYIVGGSIIEKEKGDSSVLYNTCTVWSPNGELIARHRKVNANNFHVFDFVLSNLFVFRFICAI